MKNSNSFLRRKNIISCYFLLKCSYYSVHFEVFQNPPRTKTFQVCGFVFSSIITLREMFFRQKTQQTHFLKSVSSHWHSTIIRLNFCYLMIFVFFLFDFLLLLTTDVTFIIAITHQIYSFFSYLVLLAFKVTIFQ